MSNIDIQFSVTKCKGLVARLIQFAQGGDPYVHAFVGVRVRPEPGDDISQYRDFIANAEFGVGLITRPHGYWDGGDVLTTTLALEADSASQMLHYIELEVRDDTPYDLGDDEILGLDMVAARYVPWLPRAPFRWLERRHSHGKTLMCSQFVVDVLRAGGFDPWPGVASGSVAPREIHQWISKQNGGAK